MAFFNFRWPGSKPAAEQTKPRRSSANTPSESIEELRRRARHRLIGASVLVLAGVLGFPLVFDSQPRPVAVNMSIDIPQRNPTAPLAAPGQAVRSGAASKVVLADASLDADEEIIHSTARKPAKPEPARALKEPTKESTKDGAKEPTKETPAKAQARPEPLRPVPVPPQIKVDPKPEPKPAPKPESKPEPKPKAEPKPEPKVEHKADPKAEAKPAAKSAAEASEGEGRYIVQVGAFTEADKLREVRWKLERAGMKTYTQEVGPKDARRTRVRLGPFATRAQAEQAANRVKSLGLPVGILTF